MEEQFGYYLREVTVFILQTEAMAFRRMFNDKTKCLQTITLDLLIQTVMRLFSGWIHSCKKYHRK